MRKNIAGVIILALVVTDYFLMGLTFQGVMTFIISMAVSIIICKRYEKIKNIGPYFFVTGMVTCFFDLLTHPIITLGIPLIVYFLIKQKKEDISAVNSIKIIIGNAILWGLGYILANIAKWVIVDLLYNRDLIEKSITQFLYRSQNSDSFNTQNTTWYDAIVYNFKYAGIKSFIFIIPILIYMIYYLIRNYKSISINIKDAWPYLIIAIMPICWYIVMKNHDILHDYFTWRGLIVFYLGIGIFMMKLLNENSVVKENLTTEKEAKKQNKAERK